MAASTGVIVANVYYIQPLLADIARAFRADRSPKVGLVAMLTQVGTALGMLFFVPLGDNKERRSLITLMLIGATIALTLTATARNPVWLALACFAVGVMGSTVHLFIPFAAHLGSSAGARTRGGLRLQRHSSGNSVGANFQRIRRRASGLARLSTASPPS